MEMQAGEQRSRPQAGGNGNAERIANGLGWFSIGLGLAEVLIPDRLIKFMGSSEGTGTRSLVRFYGLREIAAGIGILSQERPAEWIWGRVAGDALDLASLGTAMSADESNKARLGMATAAVAGVTALDVYCGLQLSRSFKYGERVTDGRHSVTKTIIINRSPEEVYSFWRDFENMPKFVDTLDSVRKTGDRRLHWKAKGPAEMALEWEAEVVNEEPNKLISWRTTPGSHIDMSGAVRFERATGGRGTLVRVEIEYLPPGGAVGVNLAKLFGAEPGQQIDRNLRLLKQVLETGDIVKSDASIHLRIMHPAQPPTDEELQTIRHPQGGIRSLPAEAGMNL